MVFSGTSTLGLGPDNSIRINTLTNIPNDIMSGMDLQLMVAEVMPLILPRLPDRRSHKSHPIIIIHRTTMGINRGKALS
jgi:hypothetical protein